MKILLVDDSKTMRNIQRRSLEALGAVEFAEAGDGVEALALIAANPAGFGLILCDWNMPNLNGIAVVNSVRATDKRTPIIMCTTEAEKGNIITALKAGVNNYVIKPFTPEALFEKVKLTLAKSAAA